MRSKEYLEMFIQDYELGEKVPRETFYCKDENGYILVDNSKGKCRMFLFKYESSCLAFLSRNVEQISLQLRELEIVKEYFDG